MTSWRKFRRLTAAERALLLRAGVLLAVIRIALWVLPWRSVIGMLSRCRTGTRRSAEVEIDRFAWTVRTASRIVPAATCLTQSLTLHWLLSCAGHFSRVQIGVAKDWESGFCSHAWVEYRGRALLSTAAETLSYSLLLTIVVP